MALDGLSTIGILLGYKVEATAGTMPTSGYTKLTRINAIGGASAEQESIDASALEDTEQKNIAGRTSFGDTISVTVNVTGETVAEWNTLISAYNTAKASGKGMWFEVYDANQQSSGNAQGYFFKASPPSVFPLHESNQNELKTVEIQLVLEKIHGYDTGTLPS